MADTCPVCLIEIKGPEDNNGYFIKLRCKHKIHKKCARGLCETSCPVCRAEVKWPIGIAKRIARNKARYRKEKEEEELEELISSFDSSLNMYEIEFAILLDTIHEKYGFFAEEILQFHENAINEHFVDHPDEIPEDDLQTFIN